MTKGYTENTGTQPVSTGTLVDVLFRCGTFAKNVPAGVFISHQAAIKAHPENDGYAEDWDIDPNYPNPYDIIEWRLAQPE